MRFCPMPLQTVPMFGRFGAWYRPGLSRPVPITFEMQLGRRCAIMPKMRAVVRHLSTLATVFAVLLAGWCCTSSACLLRSTVSSANAADRQPVSACPLCCTTPVHPQHGPVRTKCPLCNAGFVLGTTVEHQSAPHLALGLVPNFAAIVLHNAVLPTTGQNVCRVWPGPCLTPPPATLLQLHCALTI